MLLCFIDPRVRKIRKEASSCPGIFSRTLRFYYVASSPGSPLPHLLDGHRKLVGSSAIPARSCPGPVRYPWRSIVDLEVPPDETPGLMTFTPTTPTYYKVSFMLNHHTHPTNPIRDKKTNAFDTSMASPSRQRNFTVRVSHRCIVTVAEFRRFPQRRKWNPLWFSEFGRSHHRVWALPPSLGALSWW